MELSKAKLLIVDDEVDLCQVLSWDFEDYELDVTLAYSGNQAIDLLKNGEYDIVLTDIKMPDGDGVELLEYIHKNVDFLKGVYLMTGYSDYPVDKLKELGMIKLFKKPVNTDEILAEIKKL